jgi:transcriptional regulator with XRE-family HTH domain
LTFPSLSVKIIIKEVGYLKAKKQGRYKNTVKAIRESKNITQKVLVEKLKARGFQISESYLSQIESGFKHIPYGLAVAICEELGFESNYVTEIFLPSFFTGSENNSVNYISELPLTGTD